MKTIRLLSFALILSLVSLSQSAFANNGDDPQTTATLRKDIVKLVDNPDLEVNGIASEEVMLKFYLNNEQEIVVVDTGTDNAYLDSFIKNRLNYKRMKENAKAGFYRIKITFKAS